MNNKTIISNYGGISLGDPKDTDDFKFFTYEQLPKFTDKHQSLLSKILTKKLFEKLKDKKTKTGFSFSNVIQSGIERPTLDLGVVAGDEESYSLFKDLFYKIIKQWHDFDPTSRKHISDVDIKKINLNEFNSLDLNKYIISTRISSIRNISGYPLPAGTTDQVRKDTEEVLKKIFQNFKRNFSGEYYSIDSLSNADLKNLQKKEYIFKDPHTNSLLLNSGAARNWPNSRGVFSNDDHTILCWCNRKDHCSIISLQDGHNIKKTFENFCALSDAFSNNITSISKTIMRSETLGYLSSSPNNLGTGIKASVKIKLPKLIRNRDILNKLCTKNYLEIKNAKWKGTISFGNVLDIANKRNLGITEVELLQNFVNGVIEIIQAEEKM